MFTVVGSGSVCSARVSVARFDHYLARDTTTSDFEERHVRLVFVSSADACYTADSKNNAYAFRVHPVASTGEDILR